MSYGKYVYLKIKVRMQKIILILNVGMLSAFIGNQAMKTSIVTNDVLLENVEALANYESPEIIICDFYCFISIYKVAFICHLYYIAQCIYIIWGFGIS